jgi:serine-type D-Ala-D-Ala carboxypeptidase/endopeptidase (penicillin-binding protein 4)
MKHFFFILFFTVGVSLGQSFTEKLDAAIQSLFQKSDFKNSLFGFSMLEAETGKVVYEYNSDKTLVPASTLKTLTTGAALGILGKDYVYETRLAYTGSLVKETGDLNGDLIIIGSGDPSLESQYFRSGTDSNAFFREVLSALKKSGIKKLNGNIFADNSCFENELPGNWIWSDIGNYFGVGANGLSCFDNKFSIYLTSQEEGKVTKVSRPLPGELGLVLENKVIAGGSSDNAFVYGSPGEKKRLLTGTIPPNKLDYEIEAAMPDPAFFLIRKFYEFLRKEGIEISGLPMVGLIKADTKTLCTHYSPPLKKLVYHCNLKSNNHYAESFLKTLAHVKFGVGNSSQGILIVEDYWKKKGVDIKGLFMSDGSGLSRANGITPKIQAEILHKIFVDSSMFPSFYESLPVAGVSGSLSGIGKGSAIENNLRSKSGYIERVRGYCGYVKGKSNKVYCFSLLLNQFSSPPFLAKKEMEKILILLSEAR